MRLIVLLLEALLTFASWFFSPLRLKHKAEQKEKNREVELQKRIDATTKAVEKGDEDKVNERLKKLTLCFVLLAFMLLPASGCVRTRIHYIPAEMKAIHVALGQTVTAEYDSWLVPTPRMVKLMEKAERYDALINEVPLPNIAKPKGD